ncbi:MAG: pirin family protein [Candidatus Rokubacteria bacterium]|nr:pirin family protein [Candidatus Rokubacteria bacterium]
MIQVDRRDQRYHFENDWLSAYWHFSFDHYYDPARTHFGPLRVFNDDTVRPRRGFPMHPHREMEIVTVVLSGTLEHEDNQGNREILEAGEVQVMSAGTGIVHAERNPSPTVPLHLLQIWIRPERFGGPPHWVQAAFRHEAPHGPIIALASGEGRAGALPLGQSATIYWVKLGPAEAVTFRLRPGRRAYLFAIGGGAALAGHDLQPGDAVRIQAERAVRLRATRSADLLLLDLP